MEKSRNINAKELTLELWREYLQTKEDKFLQGLSECKNGALTEDMINEVKKELEIRKTLTGRFWKLVRSL